MYYPMPYDGDTGAECVHLQHIALSFVRRVMVFDNPSPVVKWRRNLHSDRPTAFVSSADRILDCVCPIVRYDHQDSFGQYRKQADGAIDHKMNGCR
jgi:hypothetical protein